MGEAFSFYNKWLITFARMQLIKAIMRRRRDRNTSGLLPSPGPVQGPPPEPSLCHVLPGPGGLWPVAGGPLWSLPCSSLLMSGDQLAVLPTCAEALVDTSNLNKIPLKHIPGLTGKMEDTAFKKFMLPSGHLEDHFPANFRWEFDWILSEYFCNFWERIFFCAQL